MWKLWIKWIIKERKILFETHYARKWLETVKFMKNTVENYVNAQKIKNPHAVHSEMCISMWIMGITTSQAVFHQLIQRLRHP